jgi:hypothetical protein
LFGGVVDKQAGEVKRLLRAKRILASSILTPPVKTERLGQTIITGFEHVLSVDLTPLRLEGMLRADRAYVVEQQAGGRRMTLTERPVAVEPTC